MIDMTNIQPGCYVDGHHGHYGIARMIEVAVDIGYPIAEDDAQLVADYDAHNADDGYDFDGLVWIADRATDWLNDNARLDGHYWEWNDGEFGLYEFDGDDD